MAHKTQIKYIECKGVDGIVGPARIGRVTFSKTGQSLYYHGRHLYRHNGFKANYIDAKTAEEYWISGCKKDGTDALYSTTVEIDEDVREEYWRTIRNQPEFSQTEALRDLGKYRK